MEKIRLYRTEPGVSMLKKRFYVKEINISQNFEQHNKIERN